jgi:methylmalonyl-CoA mutase cobalamin-binding subunit
VSQHQPKPGGPVQYSSYTIWKMEADRKTVVAAALGDCVHVAGVINFLRLAEIAGWRTVFLGPAVSIDRVLAAARQEHADLVAVSYRLTPENGERLLAEFTETADDLRSSGVRFAFGGTPPLAARARSIGFFERVFEGGEPADGVLSYLKGQSFEGTTAEHYPATTIKRITWKKPYPLLRHHFGLPSVESTRLGIAQIARAKVLDVISLGIDQDAQANFFHPERQDRLRSGAGGVSVRTADDYRALFEASRCGNYPLMRTYSGCDDFIRLAEMYLDTIQNAWCAIPLFWFNQMDGRGPWDLEGSIREHQKVMAWYGQRHIPVELNEPHHWGMRDAPDVIFVAAAYLSAYNARAFGVHDYIAQLMFNSPPGLSDAMDLAKMLAVLDLIQPLSKDVPTRAGMDSDPDPTRGGFRIWLQTRTGLLSYPQDLDAARAHLSTSIYLQMALHPHIVHVVGHTEAHHAATPQDVIEACKLAHRAIDNALAGQPEMISDPKIQHRRQELVSEALCILQAIRALGEVHTPDPWTNPATLARAITTGILDAPHLINNPYARGKVQSRIIDGACQVVDARGRPISENERLAQLEKEGPR